MRCDIEINAMKEIDDFIRITEIGNLPVTDK